MPACSQCQTEQPESFTGERCPRCGARWNARPRKLSGFSMPAYPRSQTSPRPPQSPTSSAPPTGEYRLEDGVDRWDSVGGRKSFAPTNEPAPKSSSAVVPTASRTEVMPDEVANHPESGEVLEYGTQESPAATSQKLSQRPFSERPKSFGRPATGSYPTAQKLGVRSTQNMGLDETRAALDALEREKARPETAVAPRTAAMVPPPPSTPPALPLGSSVPPPLPSSAPRDVGGTTRAFGPAKSPSTHPPAQGVVATAGDAPTSDAPRNTLVGITNDAADPLPYGETTATRSAIGTTANIFIGDEVREAANHLPHSWGSPSSSAPPEGSAHEGSIHQTLQAIPVVSLGSTLAYEGAPAERPQPLDPPVVAPISQRPPPPPPLASSLRNVAPTIPTIRTSPTPDAPPASTSAPAPAATSERAPEAVARPTATSRVPPSVAATDTVPYHPSQSVVFPSTFRRLKTAMVAAGAGLLVASAIVFTTFDARLVLWLVPGAVSLLIGAVPTAHTFRTRVAVMMALPVLTFELLGVPVFTRFGALTTALLLATLPPALLVRRDLVALARTRDAVAFALILAGAWVLTPGAGGVLSGTFGAHDGAQSDFITGTLLPWILLSLLGLQSRNTTAGCGWWACGVVLWSATLPLWRLVESPAHRTAAAVRDAVSHAIALGSLSALVAVSAGTILLAHLQSSYEKQP